MDKTPLETFFSSLIPNLWEELVFFIPAKYIPSEIMENFQNEAVRKLFNKILVMDTFTGPMLYNKDISNKNIILKVSKLDQNIYALLQEQSNTEASSFNFILEKYYHQVECLYFISHWMQTNLHEAQQIDNNIEGLFQIQANYYKTHLETFLKQFYPNKGSVPKGHFDIVDIIETYLPDISRQYIKPNEETVNTPEDITQQPTENIKPTPKKTKKQPIITENEAETVLLKSIFKLDIKNLK
ncbi:hypothetical protein [Mariniflexile sp. AS56]|uniref:hypothetical protein n=1 Tax=Mariniflexile sp. AS56 TaxID=3063957 RepID=UPI0026EF8CBB|nr:hypothetical protein [Mariniflexile sp. AS56]MDO7174262.1 hypothetical protein [Mariniflexile sp. AS56]